MALVSGTLRFTRDQLVEALEARRPWAENYDRRNLAEHKKAEREFLSAFRAACREAAKWNYDTAKENWFSIDSIAGFRKRDRPSCPTSAIAQLDQALNLIAATRQDRFMISESGTWSRLFWLLTYDENIDAEMC